MGLFDDFDIDMDEVEAAGTGFDFPDGHYDFEITEALTQNGSKNKPDNTYFIVKYELNDGEVGTYWEWYTVAVNGSTEHADAKRSLGYLKSRLADLGIPAAQMNSLEEGDLDGIRGTLELKTTNGKGKNAGNTYQNVRNVKVNADEAEEPAEDEADTKKKVAAAAAKKAAPATTQRATRKPKVTAPADDEDEENPFG